MGIRKLTIEERRLERLRNLIQPLWTLSDILNREDIDECSDDMKKLIKECAISCKEHMPLVKKALDSKTTLEELENLYLDPKSK